MIFVSLTRKALLTKMFVLIAINRVILPTFPNLKLLIFCKGFIVH